MPLTFPIRKRLVVRSDKVKFVDIHPEEQWVLSSLYCGHVTIHNYTNQSLIKHIEISTSPIRCARFIAKRHWVVACGDEFKLWVYNYNSLDKLYEFEAHTDYIRYIDVHSTLNYVLTSSDDLTVCLWDYGNNWVKLATFEAHLHYVMMAKWHPNDSLVFGSCSLDRSIKIWSLQADKLGKSTLTFNTPNFTLDGHESGVKAFAFFFKSGTPYIVSGSEDASVRIWDYQTKQCLQVLVDHTAPVSSILAHSKFPLILTGSEDGHLNIWHSNVYRLERKVAYDMGSIWALTQSNTDNFIALGYDEGTIAVELGDEVPIASLFKGRIFLVKNFDILSGSIRGTTAEHACGQNIQISFKPLGCCEFFPRLISNHPSGRFFAVLGDGEYIIFTAQGMKNKSFGKATQFVWSTSGDYATFDQFNITIYREFEEFYKFKPAYPVTKIFGGHLLGVASNSFITFFDWNEHRLVRRIQGNFTDVFWSDNNTRVALISNTCCYILKYDHESFLLAVENNIPEDDEGITSTFELDAEINERIVNGVWVCDTFVYTTIGLRLYLYTLGSPDVHAYLDRKFYVLGYSIETHKIYLIDRDSNIVSYEILESYLRLNTAMFEGDWGTVIDLASDLPTSLVERVSSIVESMGNVQLAIAITDNPARKFELALSNGEIQTCIDQLNAEEKANAKVSRKNLMDRWRRLGDKAFQIGDLSVATTCFEKINDISSLILIHIQTKNREELNRVSELALQNNILNYAFHGFYLLGNFDKCIEILLKENSYGAAVLFASTYAPSRLPDVAKGWKEQLEKEGIEAKIDLTGNEDYELALKIERIIKDSGIYNKSVNESNATAFENVSKFDISSLYANKDPKALEEFKNLINKCVES